MRFDLHCNLREKYNKTNLERVQTCKTLSVIFESAKLKTEIPKKIIILYLENILLRDKFSNTVKAQNKIKKCRFYSRR